MSRCFLNRRTADPARSALNGVPGGRLAPTRRLLLGALGSGFALASAGLRAQAWPARPLRLLLGYAPGGAADVTARELAVPLGKALGQTIVVESKPGASGTIAAAEAARAAPDGYTLGLLDNAPLTIVPAIRAVGYDPATAFTSVAMITQLPQMLLVPANAPYRSVPELIDALKKAPGRLSYASGGSGSVGHLAGELFKARTGTFAVHVPYRGGAPAVAALLAGDVQFAFLTYTVSSSMIASGKLRALGVSSLARLPSLPTVPTIAEAGVPGFEAPGWFGLIGPAGLPAPVVAALRKALAETLAAPALVARFETLGQTMAAPGVDLGRTIATEFGTWKKLIGERRIVIEE